MMNSLSGSRLPPPPNVLESSDMRVQELIYGHRFMQEQEPFMIVLETLAVCAATPLGSVQPGPKLHETIHYALPHRRKMRFLLFQDRHLEQVVEDSSIPDHEKWQEWKTRVNAQFGEGQSGSGVGTVHDAFAYLNDRFSRDINALHQAVRLLQSRELDVMHNRRWTSRFLAVTGPDMICTDMREAGGSWTADRRFFGRGGELVYLMLNRSSLASELMRLIDKRLLSETDPMNRIAQALSDPADTGASNTQIGYLPHLTLPAYDRLAEDWLNVLMCNRLPEGHLFEPLFRITGLNIVVYLAERAQDELGAPRRMPIVADLTDGGNQHLREEAKVHLNLHRDSANRAVRAFVEHVLGGCDRWRMAQQRSDPGLAKQALRERFGFTKGEEQRGGAATPAQQLAAFIEHAMQRDKNNIYKYLLPLAKASGLATSRQRVGPWFALDDGMLFALVLANVTHTIELRDFVAQLYRRYGLVIGPEEARDAFGRIHVERYEANLAALEARMTRLALTQRLSDDCAFVTNPYRL
ncbi:MAG: hypothetical protein ACXIUV_00195 [Alkalilacustris sp.]